MIIEIKKSIKPIKYENAISFLEKRLDEIHTKKRNELIWILEHKDVYTAGTNYKDNELLDKSINLITDNMLKDNFIIYSKETKLPKIKKQDQDFDNFKLKAKLRLANNIYNVYDLSLNRKYNVEINSKSLNRIKNSF